MQKRIRFIICSIIMISATLTACSVGTTEDIIGVVQTGENAKTNSSMEFSDEEIQQHIERTFEAITHNEQVDFLSPNGEIVYSLAENEIAQKVLTKINYDILEVQSKEEGNATVKISVQSPDLITLIEEFSETDTPITDFNPWVLQRLEENIKYLQGSLSFEVQIVNEIPLIVLNNDLYHMFSGGLTTFQMQKNQEIYESMKEVTP